MKRLLRACSVLVVMAVLETAASAQVVSQFDPEDAVAPISIVEGPGVKVGEGTVLHPIFGLETGFISNVFYQNDQPTGAGVLRLLGQIGAGSLPFSRLAPPVISTVVTDAANESGQIVQDAGDFEYRADLRLAYDALLSGSEVVRGTGGLGIGATMRGLVNPLRTWSFGFNDDYHRLIRAANFETDADTNRDINAAFLRLYYQPTDHAFSGMLHYENVVDVFEKDTQQFANRFFNTVGIRALYQWLPVTRAGLNISQGYYTGIGSSTKVTSYPFKAYASLETLIGVNTTLTLNAGITAGFYSTGNSFVGPVLGGQFGYRYSPLGRFVVEYMWAYEDSVNANYYRDHIIRGWIQQAFVPFVVVVQPELHFREYVDTIVTTPTGGNVRDDVIFSTIAGIHYNLRNWWALTADYHFATIQTNFTYMTDGLLINPSYVRHELLFGTRVAM